MTITFKDLKIKKNMLGQFMTPDILSDTIIKTNIYNGVIIEPSFGLGSFLNKLDKQYDNIIGIEYDETLFSKYTGSAIVHNMSFYQFSLNTNTDYITFVGNPPYRSPAISLNGNDSTVISMLCKKYNLCGIKEEAVFFITKAIDIIKTANVPGMIHMILPTTIFENNSKAFTSFRKMLSNNAPVIEIVRITDNYTDVSQPLCVVKMLVNQPVTVELTNSLVLSDTIEFQHIFKKTYLGSVPCEGIFMSCKDESLNNFISRLVDIFINNVDITDGLLFNGTYHLRTLRNSNAAEKFKILNKYVSETKTLIDINEFANVLNYKLLAHRNETRWYFRHTALTKATFVYILNPHPAKSFYFPGNPSKSSTDYFGYCDFDVNRNSSPGANRTVPIDNIEENICDEFKQYWFSNTDEPLTKIFEYIIHVSKSSWYKTYKSKYQRFYFGIPKIFDNTFSEKYIDKS